VVCAACGGEHSGDEEARKFYKKKTKMMLNKFKLFKKNVRKSNTV
jgi:hypothetical protein